MCSCAAPVLHSKPLCHIPTLYHNSAIKACPRLTAPQQSRLPEFSQVVSTKATKPLGHLSGSYIDVFVEHLILPSKWVVE